MSEKINSQVKFFGLLRDMNALRREMDIGVVVSKSEAFGRVTIEGMLSGMIMIGANIGGTAELIKDKITGYLYSHDSVDELAELIEYVYYEYHKTGIIQDNAFNFALEFTKGKCAEQIEKIIFDFFH